MGAERSGRFRQHMTVLALAVALAGCRDVAPTPVADEPALFAGVPGAHRVWQGIRLSWTAAVSPGGRFLAAHSVLEASDRIEVLDLEAGTSRFLRIGRAEEPAGGRAETVVFDPASRRLAFVWWSEEWQRYEIRTTDLEGVQPRTLWVSPSPDHWVMLQDWSPDGERLLVLFWTPDTPEVGMMDVGTGEMRMLGGFGATEPTGCRFSPTGEVVVCDPLEDSSSALRMLHVFAAGGSPDAAGRRLPGTGNVGLLGWTPDGTRILFLRDENGGTGVWAQRVDGMQPVGAPQRLIAGMGLLQPISVAGGAVFLGVVTGGEQVHTARLEPETLRLTSDPKPIEPFVPSGSSMQGVWSPDGGRLAYLRRPPGRATKTNIVVRAMPDGPSRRLPTHIEGLGKEWTLRWGADSQTLLAIGRRPDRGEVELLSVDAETGEIEPVTNLTQLDAIQRTITLSPDRRTLYFARRAAARDSSTIFAHDLATASERSLAHAAVIDRMTASPDGHALAFLELDPHADHQRVVALSIAEGTAREIVRVSPAGSLLDDGMVNWSPEGDRVLFGRCGARGGSETPQCTLESIGVEGSAPEVLAALSWFENPQVHPAGDRLALGLGLPRSEIWKIDIPEVAR